MSTGIIHKHKKKNKGFSFFHQSKQDNRGIVRRTYVTRNTASAFSPLFENTSTTNVTSKTLKEQGEGSGPLQQPSPSSSARQEQKTKRTLVCLPLFFIYYCRDFFLLAPNLSHQRRNKANDAPCRKVHAVVLLAITHTVGASLHSLNSLIHSQRNEPNQTETVTFD